MKKIVSTVLLSSLMLPLYAQKYELSAGLGVNVGWFRGKGQLDVPFSKGLLPNFQIEYRHRINERHQLSAGLGIAAIQSAFSINTFTIDGQPIVVDNLLSVDYNVISLKYNYLILPVRKTSVGVGIFYAFEDRSVIAFNYNLKISGGIFIPYYSMVTAKQSMGLLCNVRQPVFTYRRCRFELEGFAKMGLNNANNNPYFPKPDPIFTRHLGISFHTVWLPPKKLF